jgi:hypothetical protein
MSMKIAARHVSQKRHGRSLKNEARQPSGKHRTGVDVDAVAEHLRVINWRVPMHDGASVIHRRLKELFPYPDQIVLNLMFQRNARSDASMDEQVVAAPISISKTLKEQNMRSGQ